MQSSATNTFESLQITVIAIEGDSSEQRETASESSFNTQAFQKINSSLSRAKKQILRLKARVLHCLRAMRCSMLQRFISHLTTTQNRSTRARRNSSKSSAGTHSSKSSDGDGAPSDSWRLTCLALLRYFFTLLPFLTSPSDVFASTSFMEVAK